MNGTIGQPLPQARVEAYVRGEAEPRALDFSEYNGRWLVLFFYPRGFTFICPTEITAFATLTPEFEQENAAVVVASTDSYHSQKAWSDVPSVPRQRRAPRSGAMNRRKESVQGRQGTT